MAEKREPVALWALIGVLACINLSIISTGRRIEAQLSRATTLYLCTELAKLGGKDPLCEPLPHNPPSVGEG